VAGYNGLARRYCDPYFRRLSSAETIFYAISEDGLTASFEIAVVGTCRNCDNGIKVYDPESFLLNANITYGRTVSNRRMSSQESRKLQLDTTCYCNVASPRDLGPSEPEVVKNFGALVNELSLESIRNVSDCKFLTFFQTAVFLNFRGDVASATQDELDLIGETFVNTYNQASQEEGVCDNLFRELTDYRVDRNVAIDNGFLLSDAQGPGGRRLLSRTSYVTRKTQDAETFWPTSSPTSVFAFGTDSPTSSPTSVFEFGTVPDINVTTSPTSAPTLPVPVSDVASDALILLQVSGTCRGCSSEFGLFDQVSARRHLQGGDTNTGNTFVDTVKQRVDSCFCPPQSTRVEPSQEQVRQALSSLPFVDAVVLDEVALVQCSVEVVEFETAVVLDFWADGEIDGNDEEAVGTAFITTYTRISPEYCDELFRRPGVVESITSEAISPPDLDGIYRVRFWLELKGVCRGCKSNEDLFDRRRRRQLQEQEFCFCDPEAEDRAPRTDEFEVEYAADFEGRRRSLNRHLQTNFLRVAGVWQGGDEPPATDPPTASPGEDGAFQSPSGIQNYPNCQVPAGTRIFIGDGYCDREREDPNDATSAHIYNTEACGWDGGDWYVIFVVSLRCIASVFCLKESGITNHQSRVRTLDERTVVRSIEPGLIRDPHFC
jgi:Fe-S cluster biogenesis protein NfuA